MAPIHHKKSLQRKDNNNDNIIIHQKPPHHIHLTLITSHMTKSITKNTRWRSRCLLTMTLLTSMNIHTTTAAYSRVVLLRSCILKQRQQQWLTQLKSASNTDINETETKHLKSFHQRKDNRRKHVGKPKAMDRGDGRYANVYKVDRVAKSGVPNDYLTKPFTVLGIESSCDDTGAAVVRSDGAILGEALASQAEIHEEFGGIVPGLARDAHANKIDGIIAEALHKADMSMEEIDAVGVTVGPGLEICLRIGCNAARDLAIKHKKPFVGVHHLEAHILMSRLPPLEMDFPFLALLVSGGHCQILKCLDIGEYSFVGGTLDDSLGEAFDKTARLLGLKVGGGGGPAVEELALSGDAKAITLPVPMQNRADCDFSYAGLKNAVRLACKKLKAERGLAPEDELDEQDKANVAASFQNVAIKHIEQRLKRAMKQCEADPECQIKSLAVVGGVAANKELRSRLQTVCDAQKEPWTMAVPPPRLCTDQGTMSAWAAIERIKVGSTDEAESQDVFARFPFSGDMGE